jgi:glutamate-1-semialdehyde 2,1-aminomutase
MPDKIERPTVNSEAAFRKAQHVMPGGVSSPVRAYKAVGGTPIFIREGTGCIVKDIDGNTYIDYVCAYGPLIAGHAHERIVAAVSKAIGRGSSFGAPSESETQLAVAITDALPAADMIRFVNSGTEAVMSALRLARAATGRAKIVKCVGGYHGHADPLLVQAGSGALTLGTPSSPGVPAATVADTLLVDYNDLGSAASAFEQHPNQIAAFIVEPVAGNMGVIPPAAGYLPGLRALCDQHGALLIFDEVMTGFRVAWGGAQVLYNVRPDLTCLAKVIGGGLPCGAYAGPRNLMEQISPAGSVYQAGTLSGNPVAMAAGLATLEILKEPGSYNTLEQHAADLATGLIQAAAAAKVPITVNRVGSMLTPFFTHRDNSPVTNYTAATSCNAQSFTTFFNAIRKSGILLAPSPYEAMFVSLSHGQDAIDQTIAAAAEAFAVVADAK